MELSCSTRITDLGEVGKGSCLEATLSSIADDLPLSKKLRSGLKRLSAGLEEASLHIITFPDKTLAVEERGRYMRIAREGTLLIAYTKGIGSMQNLLSVQGRDDVRGKGLADPRLLAFGPNACGQYLYDSPLHDTHFPRIIGVEYTTDAKREFLHALRVMTSLALHHGIETVEGLLEKGITIPISTAKFPGLTSYLEGLAAPELTGNWQWDSNIEAGSVMLLVPSTRRTQAYSPGTEEEALAGKCIVTAIREVYSRCGAILSAESMHDQNFYLAKSVCPQADNSDLLFDLEPQERMNHFAGSVLRLVLRPDSETVRSLSLDLRTFVEELCSETISSLPTNGREFAALMKYAAQELEGSVRRPYCPSERLVEKVMGLEAYNWIEQKRHEHAKSARRYSIISEIEPKLM
ncbi:hypothetical protein JW826_01010 [Candidatus Woesearchaeota archaeon]|nr:hypothetical protein [Candidatus Woesearchaeota archaeon]